MQKVRSGKCKYEQVSEVQEDEGGRLKMIVTDNALEI